MVTISGTHSIVSSPWLLHCLATTCTGGAHVTHSYNSPCIQGIERGMTPLKIAYEISNHHDF